VVEHLPIKFENLSSILNTIKDKTENAFFSSCGDVDDTIPMDDMKRDAYVDIVTQC
jgi:hypothetical protein